MSLDAADTGMVNDGRVWLVVSLVMFMLAPIAVADEWKVTGALDQSVEYDDNIDMRVDATPAFGYLLRPSFSANWNTAIMNIGISGAGDIRRYDDKRWDCETFSVGYDQQYQQRLNVFSLAADYSQSCSYLDQASDTGVLVPNNQTETYNIAPAWNWQWSPLDQFTFSPSYSKLDYLDSGTGTDNNTGTTSSGFQGYETYSLNLSENHLWTRRLSSTISLFFSRTEFGDSDNSSEQNVFGFQVSSQYAITRMWSINVGGGLNWVERPPNSGSIDNSDDSLQRTEVINLALSYEGRRMDYSLGYSRTLSPSSIGQIVEYNSVNMNYSYQISREFTFNIDGSISLNKSVGDSEFQSVSDRTYYNASIGLVWDFAREWQLSTSYRYRRQEYNNDDEGQVNNELASTSDSNALMITLNYNWDGLRVFR